MSPDAEIAVDVIAVVWIIVDNPAGLVDGDSAVLSVSDTDGHTWTRLKETTNDGTAAAGCTCALFATKVTSAIGVADTVTVTITSAVTAKAMGIHEFSVGAGKTFSIADATAATGLSDTLSVTSGTVSSVERLWLGLGGQEASAANLPTAGDVDYTDACDADGLIGTTGAPATGNVGVKMEFRIATLTSDTYAIGPFSQAPTDWVAIIVALDEIDANNRAELSWAELEVPGLDNRAEVSWAEFEIPLVANRAELSWAEFEVPLAPNRAEVSWAELEVPSLDNRAEVSWAELEVPEVGEAAGWLWFYVMGYVRGMRRR